MHEKSFALTFKLHDKRSFLQTNRPITYGIGVRIIDFEPDLIDEKLMLFCYGRPGEKPTADFKYLNKF